MLLYLWIFSNIWVFSNSARDFRPGVCPTDKLKDSCNYEGINGCKSDSSCPGVQKCCPNECGPETCKQPLLKDRPGCPPFDPDLRCVQFIQQCNSDNDCKQDELCCFQPACGTSCQKKKQNKQCPPYRRDVLCKRHINNCDCNSDCPKGQICCAVECGTDCRKPGLDVQCPLVKCVPLPPNVCSRDTYEIIGGRKCKFCPEIIPCNADCLLPKIVGPCRLRIERYFYDVKTKSCKLFYYGGCQGNANNYKTLQECIRTCTTVLPIEFCPTVKCGLPPPDVCTEDVYSVYNGVTCKLCPKIVPCDKVCKLPKKPGPCKAYMPRYYYDTKTKSCQKFIYGGCQGNANNFETLEECQRKCNKKVDICSLPKKPGPCKAYFPRYYYDQQSKSCQKFIYGGCQGNANNFETLEECQQQCDNNQVCNLPKKVGPCEALIPRYFYNKKTKQCEKFNYGGCQGNANNFKTLEECQQKCTNVCNLPKKIGPCEAAITRYFYNKKTNQCEKFIYGGCQGNANNFASLGECKQTCHKNTDVCDLPKEPGPCRGSFPRYYYDKKSKSCQKFIYGGCKGNANNFETLAECNRKCVSPPTSCGPVCLIFCEFGNVLDAKGCPTCKCKPDPCSKAPLCARPAPDVCFEPTYRMIDGVKCQWCYRIVSCKPSVELKCPNDLLSKYACGNYNINCSNDASCPKGHKCCKQDCGYRCVKGV